MSTAPPLLFVGLLWDGAHPRAIAVAIAWTVIQLLLLAGVLALYLSWRVEVRSSATRIADLRTRAASAEADLARDEETLHELRATLAGIGAAARLLHEREAELPRTTRVRLQRMHDAEIARLERLLSGPPLSGPPLSGPPREDREAADLDRVVEPLVVLLRSNGHRVRWHESQCRVLAREDDVAQAVHILLQNAVRHARGSVIDLRVEAGAERVEVRVSDDGPGVPHAQRASIFERGFRSTTSPGSGLGLHIARRLARESGGDLRLEPSDHGGAVFTLTLRTAGMRLPCPARSA